MNTSTLIGVLGSSLLLFFLLGMSTDDPTVYLDWVSIGIVFVGTLAATFISYPMNEVRRMLVIGATILRKERLSVDRDIQDLVAVAKQWLTGDLHGAETALSRLSNPFLRTGLQLVIDQMPEDDLIDLMQWRIARLKAKENAEANMFRTMASFAPAFGMMGTLVGLVNLMYIIGNGDIALIGQQMALAIVTTLYGILFANIVFRPIAVKLERRTEERVELMHIILQGILMTANKRSPMLIRETLQSFVAEHRDEINERRAPHGAKLKATPPR